MAAPPKTAESAAVHHPRSSARFTEPLVAKQGSLFLLSIDTGDVLPETDQGLYFHDMRYISAETLRLMTSALLGRLARTTPARMPHIARTFLFTRRI